MLNREDRIQKEKDSMIEEMFEVLEEKLKGLPDKVRDALIVCFEDSFVALHNFDEIERLYEQMCY